jgi:hypothetical protein
MKQQYMKMLLTSSDKVMIDLSNNRFSGPIPKTVGNLTALVMLNMSRNALLLRSHNHALLCVSLTNAIPL